MPGVVLNVDDFDASRYFKSRVLSQAGFVVHEAASGSAALDAVRRHAPELVVLDVNLPDMSGYEVCRRIRSDPATAFVAVLQTSASAVGPGDRATGLDGGADAYLVEPTPPEVLVATVNALLRMRRAEAALRERADDLQRSVDLHTRSLRGTVKELEDLNYMIAHDLRAPLRAIRGYADALGDDLASVLTRDARDYLVRISVSVTRMDTLINDLLAYGRLTRVETLNEPVDVEPLVRMAIERVGVGRAMEPGAIDIVSPLPRVSGHASGLVQVFQNLIDNALKFVAPGTSARVCVRAERRAGQVRVWVEDDGIGVPDEHRERIFGAFQRLHDDASYPGTGVGLAIVRKAIERMGGTTGVESELGRGSRFWIELPEAVAGSAGRHAVSAPVNHSALGA